MVARHRIGAAASLRQLATPVDFLNFL